MQSLAGKVAFVTGAGRAQGRAIAERLAADGADIIAIDVCAPVETTDYPMAMPDDLAETARRVERLDRRILTSELDVRDAAAIGVALEAGVAELGRLDIVCANAGISTYGRLEDVGDAEWSTMIDVTLTGSFNTVREAIPHVKAGGQGGSLVLFGSVYSVKGGPNVGHYTAAKHGLIGLMKVLALELAADEIRSNCLLTGAVLTGILDNEGSRRRFFPDRDPATVTLEDMGSVLDPLSPMPAPWVAPEDIADAVAWLVSDSARYVTGVALPVDLGMLLN
jgi:SDR family mycofactocin-dependent oxidoreductase